jgi:hypothetical protein
LAVALSGTQVRYHDIKLDSLKLNFVQNPDSLVLDSLQIYERHNYNISGKGSLPYNLLTGTSSSGNQTMHIFGYADVIRLAQEFSGGFISGRGRANLDFVIRMMEDRLSFQSGSIIMPTSSVRIKKQPNDEDKLSLNLAIQDNELTVNTFTLGVGKGKLKLRNEIKNDGKDFFVAMLNLGQFYLSTDRDGIEVTIPGYSEPNSVVNVLLKGQYADEAVISGPFDDMHIEGEVELSNGSALYPPNTENLLKLINTVRETSRNNEVSNPLPFTMDLMIRMKENIRYVTYPTNFVMSPESYLHLIYNGTQWTVPEALFISEHGTLDMFGTTFSVDYLEMNITSFQERLSGTFYKKAADGSLLLSLSAREMIQPRDFWKT